MDKPKIPEWQENCHYEHLTNLDDFLGIPPNCEYVAVDIETTGLSKHIHKIVGLSFCFEEEEAYYISVEHKDSKNVTIEDLIAFCNKHFSDKTCVYWNAKFDMGFLEKAGFKSKKFLDVKIMFYNSDIANTHLRPTLKQQSQQVLDLKMLTIFETVGISPRSKAAKSLSFATIPVNDITLAYACADADITYRLFQYYRDQKQALSDKYKNVRQLDHRLIEPIQKIEDTGVCIDIPYLTSMHAQGEAKLAELEDSFQTEVRKHTDTEINIASPKQLCDYFFNTLQLKPAKLTPKGNPSTDQEAIQRLLDKYGTKYKSLEILKEWRYLEKRMNTYISSLLNGISTLDNRIHPNFNISKLITGRLSATGDGVFLQKFNSQAIPKLAKDHPYNIRKAFVPQEGFTWVAIDLSNIEVRIIANYSRDPNLIRMLNSGGNQHETTAKLVFGKVRGDPDYEKYYKIAKTMNFNLAYAFGITELKKKLEIDAGLKLTDEDCWGYFNKMFRQAYPTWGRYKEQERFRAQKEQFTTTIFGRYRDLSEDYKKAKEGKGYTGHIDNQAVNYPIQGSCADLIRLALVKCHNYLKLNQLFDDAHILLTVHDEICFEVRGEPGDEKFDLIVQKFCDIMQWYPKHWPVPVLADPMVGKSWGHLYVWEPGKKWNELKEKE